MAVKRHSKKYARAYPAYRRRRRPWRYLLVVPAVVVVLFAVSVVGALASPGNQSFAAKWADAIALQ